VRVLAHLVVYGGGEGLSYGFGEVLGRLARGLRPECCGLDDELGDVQCRVRPVFVAAVLGEMVRPIEPLEDLVYVLAQ